METEEFFGYAKIVPSARMQKLIDDSSFQFFPEGDYLEPGSSESNLTQEQILNLKSELKRGLLSIGILYSPEYRVRAQAPKLLGKFKLYSLPLVHYLNQYQRPDEKLRPNSFEPDSKAYILHPVSDKMTNTPEIKGELRLNLDNIFALTRAYYGVPIANTTDKTGKLPYETPLFYADSIFPRIIAPADED